MYIIFTIVNYNPITITCQYENMPEMVAMETEEFSHNVLDGMAFLMRVSLQDLMGYIHRKGISMAQINVLYQLYYRGPCEVLAFTRSLALSPAGASQLIERMVRQGWVGRLDDPADRRVRHVHLTESGRQLVADSIAARNEWVIRFGDRLTDDEKQQVVQVFRLLAEKTEEDQYHQARKSAGVTDNP